MLKLIEPEIEKALENLKKIFMMKKGSLRIVKGRNQEVEGESENLWKNIYHLNKE